MDVQYILLVAVLTHHVVAGKVTAEFLSGSRMSAITLQRGSLLLDGRDGLQINDANVVAADIETSNGVIHAIDQVLLPN